MNQAIEIILFALLAAYMFFRLWSILGQRTGNEADPEEWEENQSESNVTDINKHRGSARGKVVPLRPDQDVAFSEELEPEPVFNTEVQEGIREIAKHDSSFHIGHFSEGARRAFEMIIKAYAEADKEKLKELLSDSVLQKFSKLIDQRATDQQTIEVEIKSVNIAEIESIKIDGSLANISVKFASEQMVATKEANGDINDNPARLYIPMTDIWTFSRDLSSDDPNWCLSATKSQTS